MAKARKQVKSLAEGEENGADEGAASVELTDVQQVDVAIRPVDAKGNDAPIEGTPTWETSDATVCTVQPNPDDRSAVIKATGAVGSARVVVTCDADLGEGVQPLVGTLEVSVVAGQATSIELTVGKPQDQQ